METISLPGRSVATIDTESAPVARTRNAVASAADALITDYKNGRWPSGNSTSRKVDSNSVGCSRTRPVQLCASAIGPAETTSRSDRDSSD
jgi:hypothetical protein